MGGMRMANSDQEFTFEETLEVVNELKALDLLNAWLERLLDTQKIDPKTLFYLNLIGDELLTNIITYGFEDELQHIITLRIFIRSTDWVLTIRDDGRPFNLLEKANPDLLLPIEERPIGGLGIYFIQQIIDEITYERIEQTNVISMKKNWTLGKEE
jgi:serine/threonine-protein kinase RsbW